MSRKHKPNKQSLTVSLKEAVDHAERLVYEDPDVSSKLAASSNKIGDKLVFENGWVIKTKTEKWLGQKKNFYDVYNLKTGVTEASNLGLFISAMALVKIKSSKLEQPIFFWWPPRIRHFSQKIFDAKVQSFVHLIYIGLSTHFLRHIQYLRISCYKLVLTLSWLLQFFRDCIFVFIKGYDINKIDSP